MGGGQRDWSKLRHTEYKSTFSDISVMCRRSLWVAISNKRSYISES